MNNDQAAESSINQKAEEVAEAMKLIVDFNGSQLKEMRRFIDLLLQIRHQQERADEE